ncbi:hypothetical protein [Rhodococcus sp. P1Y]|uniref:hypothetical protein n=1 Tax=Rhodococcus sp. P1Y TaxID=1302308 RepID=UPI000EB00028|nr:hypothetical protein [Rhodococcus sp. P1Y]AYJ48307.1 hypothetical protein D8W71_08110 [Rhodococcus sp. P1Y]
MTDPKVYVVDRIVARPGLAKQFVEAYLANYAPGARRRHMVLESIIVSPPMWLNDQSNEITVTWTVRGTTGWWNMARTSRADSDVRQWWNTADSLVLERHRSMAVSATDVDGLVGV